VLNLYFKNWGPLFWSPFRNPQLSFIVPKLRGCLFPCFYFQFCSFIGIDNYFTFGALGSCLPYLPLRLALVVSLNISDSASEWVIGIKMYNKIIPENKSLQLMIGREFQSR